MKRYLLLLIPICSLCLLNACGGSGGNTLARHIATHFFVMAPKVANAGTDFTFTVSAIDDIGDNANGYSGTVQFTSTDGKAVLPGNVVLTGGSGTFHATLETVGMQTITATDVATTTITGANSIKVSAGATSLSVGVPLLATTEKAASFSVAAFDVLGNPVTNYPGTVTFTSTDGQAVLPSNSQLTNGASFSVTFQTAGNQTITATDVATPSLTATSTSIHVSPPASGFTPTNGMLNARESHTATLLSDGKVLVVGGDFWKVVFPNCPAGPACRPHDVPLASAELFDPASGSFTGTGSMTGYRTRHTATLLGDGKVLVTGGDSGSEFSIPFATAEIFDSSTGVFTPTGNMVSARAGHTATLLPNGKVLLTGGLAGTSSPYIATSTAEIFDPTTGEFTATSSMGTPRVNGTATLLKNGDVLVTGGDDASGNPVATAELFDPTTGMFTPTGSMSVARAWHTATLLTSGAVLVTGGESSGGANTTVTATAELFDAATGAFVLTGSMESPRELHTATKRTDGKVLVTGGVNGMSDLSTAELFDPLTGIFTHAGNMEIERLAHTATLLMNGEVLITGGSNTGLVANRRISLATAELFP